MPGIAVWKGQNDLMPYACPHCGSLGTGRLMPEHIDREHPGES